MQAQPETIEAEEIAGASETGPDSTYPREGPGSVADNQAAAPSPADQSSGESGILADKVLSLICLSHSLSPSPLP